MNPSMSPFLRRGSGCVCWKRSMDPIRLILRIVPLNCVAGSASLYISVAFFLFFFLSFSSSSFFASVPHLDIFR